MWFFKLFVYKAQRRAGQNLKAHLTVSLHMKKKMGFSKLEMGTFKRAV